MFTQGVTTNEVANFLIEKISKAELKSKITIIDAYFFSDSRYSISDFMKTVLKSFSKTLKEIEIVTLESKINQNNYNKFKKEFKKFNVKVFNSHDFHDRFWIIDDSKAFIVGTSINGIGNKHFFIQDDYLTKQDCTELLSLYKGEEL